MNELLNSDIWKSVPPGSLFWFYLGFALLSGSIVFVISRRIQHLRQRRAIVSFCIAFFFAPSVIVAGHGIIIGPAWVAALQQAGPPMHAHNFIYAGVMPIAVLFALTFSASRLFFKGGDTKAAPAAENNNRK